MSESERRRRQIALWIWGLLAVALAAWLLVSALPTILAVLQKHPDDGVIDWQGARLFLEGKNPYSPAGLKSIGFERTGFGHPPTTPFWFIPLAHLELSMAGQVVGHVVMLLLLINLLVILDELRAPLPRVNAFLLFAAVIATPWMESHFQAGQISELIAFAYVMCWYFLRRGQDVPAGALLGVACTLKLFPGIMVLFLLATRRWRTVAAAAITWLAVAAVMTSRYGAACWLQFFAMQKGISDRWAAQIQNGSLQGIVLRWFTPGCVAPGPTRVDATLITIAIAALLLFVTWRLVRRSARERGAVDVPFAMFAVLSMFLNPWVWEHYNVLLILPLLIAAAALWRARRDLPRPLVGIAALALAGVVALLTLRCSIPHFIALQREYHFQGEKPWAHLRMHLLEIGNWAPSVLLLLVLGALAFFVERRRPGAIDRVSFDEPTRAGS